MTTWTNVTKSSSPTWTNATKNTTTWTNQTKAVSVVTASPGQYYGFGAFTYSGGEQLNGGTGTVWTNLSRS